jgi:DNA (cytosine-5)-methyltransferase 1
VIKVKIRHASLFTGIGGFDLAAEWMGWENVFHCEWKEFNQKVLKYYWPNATSYTDITKTDFSIHRGSIDVLTGGFPCQPYSLAGKRKGKEDDRHLWPEMLRAIREIQPAWVVGENVPGLVSWDGGLVFEEVQTDLEAEGYEVQAVILPACSVDAPHKRERIWFVAYSSSINSSLSIQQRRQNQAENINVNRENESGDAANSNRKLPQRRGNKIKSEKAIRYISPSLCRNSWENFPTQPPICNGNDGVPTQLDGITFSKWTTESIMSGGNAIVPQVALQIFKVIEKMISFYK